MKPLFAATLAIILINPCLADSPATTHATTTHALDTHPHPLLSANPSFARPLIIAIGALFIAATLIGIIVRSESPETQPDSHPQPPHHSPHH